MHVWEEDPPPPNISLYTCWGLYNTLTVTRVDHSKNLPVAMLNPGCLSPSGLLEQKYRRLSGLQNNKNVIPIVLEVGKSKIKVPVWSHFGEKPIPDS